MAAVFVRGGPIYVVLDLVGITIILPVVRPKIPIKALIVIVYIFISVIV